ncbi:hypothetical protein [uncultured Spongiibacter sp.]|uniref:hypothetical protein n=1 Tax=uncultured Spongiibacter sp. TaxID=870896 RepID=UPI002598F7E1|nr:hypothetical protein [uncultured Spongiibacter sp.]
MPGSWVLSRPGIRLARLAYQRTIILGFDTHRIGRQTRQLAGAKGLTGGLIFQHTSIFQMQTGRRQRDTARGFLSCIRKINSVQNGLLLAVAVRRREQAIVIAGALS